MKTILVTAYAINPYKGSEDGMGWNLVMQIARHHRVIVVTRINNGPNILKYMVAHPEKGGQFENINFLYFDWPYLLRFWKKGPLLSVLYFYGWQCTLAIWLLAKRLRFDIVHNLNFHNDWTPTFLWILGKPLLWGPVGHHPKIPRAFLLPVYGKAAYLGDRLLWLFKQCFWYADPFLRIAVSRASMVLCMNSEAPKALRLKKNRFCIMPSVATEDVAPGRPMPGMCAPDTASVSTPDTTRSPVFTVLSAGRFVPLKGFDLTIRAFARFQRQLSKVERASVKLILVGSGPQKSLLEEIIAKECTPGSVEIRAWVPRDTLIAVYTQASVFLFPSHEGAGMVVAESMSRGVPVVCLRNSGPGEFLHPDSKLGVDYSSYNDTVRELSLKLGQLYTDSLYYQQEKELALRRFQDHFRWDVRGDQLDQIYQTL